MDILTYITFGLTSKSAILTKLAKKSHFLVFDSFMFLKHSTIFLRKGIGWFTLNNKYLVRGPPRGKRDGVIGHISERESGNWMEIIALLRDLSIWH